MKGKKRRKIGRKEGRKERSNEERSNSRRCNAHRQNKERFTTQPHTDYKTLTSHIRYEKHHAYQ